MNSIIAAHLPDLEALQTYQLLSNTLPYKVENIHDNIDLFVYSRNIVQLTLFGKVIYKIVKTNFNVDGFDDGNIIEITNDFYLKYKNTIQIRRLHLNEFHGKCIDFHRNANIKREYNTNQGINIISII